MEDFRHNYVNLTAFRLVQRENARVRDILQQMYKYQRDTGAILMNTSTVIQVRHFFSDCEAYIKGLSLLDL